MQNYIEQLKIKYNYDDKTINALTKIIPALIDYYGIEYEDTILKAINDTKIICCNSYQTISKIKEEEKLTPKIGNTQLKDIESEGSYISNIEINHTEDVIPVDETPNAIMKEYNNSSMALGLKMVANKEADGDVEGLSTEEAVMLAKLKSFAASHNKKGE